MTGGVGFVLRCNSHVIDRALVGDGVVFEVGKGLVVVRLGGRRAIGERVHRVEGHDPA